MFKDPQYYQDVNICSAENGNNPKAHVHMLRQCHDAIHIPCQSHYVGTILREHGLGSDGD